MARLSTLPSRGGTALPRARWIALLTCALGVAAAAVVLLLWSRPGPEPVSAPRTPGTAVPEQARLAQQETAPPTEPRRTSPDPDRPAVAVPEPHLDADGVLAVPLVVPMYASAIPEVRIPAGVRGVHLLINVAVPINLDGLTVWVRGPTGRVPARLARTGDRHQLAVELDAALQAGVHEVLVTNDDETTLAHHRLRALPAGTVRDRSGSP